jgi:hypothetical protein
MISSSPSSIHCTDPEKYISVNPMTATKKAADVTASKVEVKKSKEEKGGRAGKGRKSTS